MITTGPFTISAGETQSLANPYSSSTQANRVQVQNASPLVLTLTTGAETVTVPADSAATASLSAQVPTVAATGSGAGQYRVSWLMASDPLPIPNGPLTSEQVVIGNVPAVTITGTPDVSVASGTIDVGTLPDVNLAAGSTVDANITNATLDITGSSVNVSGGQLKTSGGLGLQPTSEQLNPAWLGDGSDGDVTISGTVTLTRDMLYSSLTVPSGAVVATAGFRIRCTGTITLDGSITNNGTDGAVSGGGLGAPAGTLPGGGNGGFTNNSGSGPAAAGFQSGLCLYGGGLGQSVLAINGATAAQGGGNGSDTPTPTIFPTISQMVSGAIGGGGGGAAYSNVSDEVSNGGGGGGPILILCNEFTGSGALASIGGSGYCESTGAAGGGGSGNVIVVCFTQSFTGNINVLGGTGVQSADYLGPAAGNGIGFILDGIEW